MMGSRGTPALSPEVAGLAMLSDLIALLKSADLTLPAAVTELRAAEADANKAREALGALQVEHDQREVTLKARADSLDGAEGALRLLEAEVSNKNSSVQERQAALDKQASVLDVKQAELDEHLAGIDGLQRAAQLEIARQKSEASQEIDAGRAQLGRERDECAALITAAHDEAHREIVKMRAAAEVECAALRERAQRLMDAALAKETAVRKHAADLAALSRD
jgi:chromosome segregation ATPase